MAILYVRSDGSNTSPYDTWAKAATTLATAVSASSAGDTIYVADGHTESLGASTNYDTNCTSTASVTRIVCVNDTGDPEPPTAVATGATISMSGNYSITFEAGMYVYGITFTTASALSNQSFNFLYPNALEDFVQTFENCTFNMNFTGLTASCAFGFQTNNEWTRTAIFNDCTFTDVGAVSQGAFFRLWGNAVVMINGGSISDSSRPSIFENGNNEEPSQFYVRGFDMSAATNTVLTLDQENHDYFEFVNCPTHASATLVSQTKDMGHAHRQYLMHNVGSTNNNIQIHEGNGFGTVVEDTGIYLDASDGTTSYSHKVVSETNVVEYIQPYKYKLADLWADTSTSKTFTIEIAQDGTTTNLQNDEIWIEVHYIDDNTCLAHIEDDSSGNYLATPADQTTSSASWTGLSGTNAKQKLAVTTSNTGKAGPCAVYLCLAKPDTTVYVDPKVTVA